jgi:hypothetical protein
MTSHVVLVSLDWLRDKDPRRSLGHASLLARLRAERDIAVSSVEFAVNAAGFTREQVLAAVLAAVRDDRSWIGIGAYVWNEPWCSGCSPALRRTGFRGGSSSAVRRSATRHLESTRPTPTRTYFIRGYGEDALAAVAATDARPGPGRNSTADTTCPSARPPSTCWPPFSVSELARWRPSGSSGGRRSAAASTRARSASTGVGSPIAPLESLALNTHEHEIEQWSSATAFSDIAVLDPIFHTNPAAAATSFGGSQGGVTAGRISLQCALRADRDDDFLDACEFSTCGWSSASRRFSALRCGPIGRKNDLVKATR